MSRHTPKVSGAIFSRGRDVGLTFSDLEVVPRSTMPGVVEVRLTEVVGPYANHSWLCEVFGAPAERGRPDLVVRLDLPLPPLRLRRVLLTEYGSILTGPGLSVADSVVFLADAEAVFETHKGVP